MPPPAKRQKVYKVGLKGPQPDEVSFDFDARADYLTGFQKRKQQRIKRAREKAVEEAKAQKIEDRKQVRSFLRTYGGQG
jgi:ribosomal RNA-processing protein 17